MDNISHFESRTGQLTCSYRELFDFVTDLRNFEQFTRNGAINNWQAEREACSFSVSMLGTVSLRVTMKESYKKVAFTGDALKKNDFSLVLDISDNIKNSAEVKVSLDAELSPMLRMMAAEPIARFLEVLINEMENFRNWEKTGF